MRCGPVMIGVVGDSGVGKTTLLESVIPALEGRGARVGAVKHASHGFVADQPGKDSYRLYEAGARAVALASPHQLAVFRRVAGPSPRDPDLSAAVALLPGDLDVVMVEGFAWEPIPRFVVVGGREAPRKELITPGSLLAILRVTDRLENGRPIYPRSVIERVADDVLRRVRRYGGLGHASAPAPASGGALTA